MLSIMTTALSHVTKHIKLPTAYLLACALRECMKLKELTLSINLPTFIQMYTIASQSMYIDNELDGIYLMLMQIKNS